MAANTATLSDQLIVTFDPSTEKYTAAYGSSFRTFKYSNPCKRLLDKRFRLENQTAYGYTEKQAAAFLISILS
jgi:hypothetical protein